MTCVVCKQEELREGTTRLSLARDNTTLVVVGVPAQVCDHCGETYISVTVTDAILNDLDHASRDQVSNSVWQYQADRTSAARGEREYSTRLTA